MAVAPAPLFTESFETHIDDLLMRICIELQLDTTRYKLAETSYPAVGDCLEAHRLVAPLKPTMYPQGSMLLDTTVKPLSGDEYDLDFVCEFICGTTSFREPVDALNLIERALLDNRVYAPMLERKNRCIRLNYAHNFHMDILPACKDPKNGGTCILVPDRKLRTWTPSNPKGFGKWFTDSAGQLLLRAMERAEPIPAQQPAQRKPPLKLCVQLWKRWRDIRYKDNADLAPISIVLTTLAGLIYKGEQSVSVALGNILQQTANAVRTAQPRLKVLNPSNPEEDLSERWDSKPDAYRAFATGITEFDAQWKMLMQARGIPNVAKQLERLFGEEVAQRVVEKQMREIEAARDNNQLGMRKGTGVISSLAATTVAVRPTTFFGGDR